jgi:hypothetical protein
MLEDESGMMVMKYQLNNQLFARFRQFYNLFIFPLQIYVSMKINSYPENK